MATSRKQGADDQNQDATHNQAQNHAQTPDQQAANSGAYAQSSYQNTQQGGAHSASASSQSHGPESSGDDAGNTNKMVDSAIQAGKKWLQDSGVMNSATELPQAAKEWGTKAMSRVSGLSTTQKAVGGALLLAGVAYLTTRGKGKSSYSSHDDDDYRSARRSGSDYKQGGWAGYAGGKSTSRRSSDASSRSEVSSYGTERRATGGNSYGRSNDSDFGSGRESSGSPYANRRGADSSSNYGAGSSRSTADQSRGQQGSSSYGSSGYGSQQDRSGSYGSQQGSSNYNSGSSYGSGSSRSDSGSGAVSGLNSGRSSQSSTPNSNEQDYDA